MFEKVKRVADLDEIYDRVLGENAPNVPGIRAIRSRELLRNDTIFKKELHRPDIREIVTDLHESGKVIAAKYKASEINLYIAENRNSIVAGGALLAGAGAFYFIRRRTSK